MEKKISKVEIDGLEALLYDELILAMSGLTYNRFIKEVISKTNIGVSETVLDFGCGTGKNLCIMRNYTQGLIVGFDTSKYMIKQAKEKCKNTNTHIFYHDIRKPNPFLNRFDIAFISFVLHGFIDRERDMIIKNAFDSLNPNGRFCILDYNEFNLDKKSTLVKAIFKYGECPLASEFIKIDLKSKLKKFGFKRFEEHLYYSNLVRLLIAYK